MRATAAAAFGLFWAGTVVLGDTGEATCNEHLEISFDFLSLEDSSINTLTGFSSCYDEGTTACLLPETDCPFTHDTFTNPEASYRDTMCQSSSNGESDDMERFCCYQTGAFRQDGTAGIFDVQQVFPTKCFASQVTAYHYFTTDEGAVLTSDLFPPPCNSITPRVETESYIFTDVIDTAFITISVNCNPDAQNDADLVDMYSLPSEPCENTGQYTLLGDKQDLDIVTGSESDVRSGILCYNEDFTDVYGSEDMSMFDYCNVAKQSHPCCLMFDVPDEAVTCLSILDVTQCYDFDVTESIHCGNYPFFSAILSDITDRLVLAGVANDESNPDLADLTVPATVEDAENWVLRLLRKIADRHERIEDTDHQKSKVVLSLSRAGGRRRRDDALVDEDCQEVIEDDLTVARNELVVILERVVDHELSLFICPCGTTLPDNSAEVEYVAHGTCVEGALAATADDGEDDADNNEEDEGQGNPDDGEGGEEDGENNENGDADGDGDVGNGGGRTGGGGGGGSSGSSSGDSGGGGADAGVIAGAVVGGLAGVGLIGYGLVQANVISFSGTSSAGVASNVAAPYFSEETDLFI
tara:strand:- start:5299 stop:7047 length:1749 start_codon:yes stop_codon:yes gene_type:complete